MYNFILENFLWFTVKHYNLVPSNVVFQQDNDPKHTSKRGARMVEIAAILIPPVACLITRFESHGAFLGSSQTTFE